MTDKLTTGMDAVPEKPMRDARLAQALQHMPDAHMQPGVPTRIAVLRQAQVALEAKTDSVKPKARRWWQSTSHSAWGGALASVMVASLITLMWYGQPVPDANPDIPATSVQSQAAAPAMALPSPAPARAPTEAIAEAKRSAPPAAAQLKQDTGKEVRKPAAPKAAEVPPLPFIPPPEVLAAAPPPAPAPAAAPLARSIPAPTMAPPPAQSALQLAPTGNLSDAVPAARTRTEISLSKASPTTASKTLSEFVYIQTNGQLRRVTDSQADALLAYLRNLRDQRAAPAQVSGKAAEHIASEKVTPAISVRTLQGERWDIWPSQMRVQKVAQSATALRTDADQNLNVFAITAAQYEDVRLLIEKATAP